MFVIAQDFDVPPYSLPNLDKVVNSFADFVTGEEETILRKVLGNLLYDQFVAGLEALPDEWVGTNGTGYSIGDQVVYGVNVWESLTDTNLNHIPVEGVNWTLVEASNKWLVLEKGSTYYEGHYKWVGMNKMLVPFIFSEWLDETYSTSSGSGEVKSKSENSVNISPIRRICRAYNAFSHVTGNGCSKINSLYGYLKENVDLYPDFVYGDPGRKNIFNL